MVHSKKQWLADLAVWRAVYAQPLVVRNYSRQIPPVRSPIAGLWLSNMAQIYPEDRGTNYAVRAGRSVAAEIAAAPSTRATEAEVMVSEA